VIPVEDARARIVAAIAPLGQELVALAEASGRVLAEDVAARRTQPPADVSAMDGYAVRFQDLVVPPTLLKRIGTSQAGGAFHGSVGTGEAVRIFTGAPVPAGADTVVLQEDTEAEGDTVLVKEFPPQGRHIRQTGIDFRTGDIGLTAGRRLTPRDIGLAAAMNRPWLSVFRRPRIAILPTGDEIVMPGDPVGPNQIVSSNSLALAAFIKGLGAEPVHLGIAKDDPQSLARLAGMARGSDMLVTIGGASVGEHDLVKQVLGEAGLTLDFWKIAMRPGKPLIFGRWHEMPVLGMPGNPVSTLVCALNFLKPAIERLIGLPGDGPEIETAEAAVELGQNDRRQDYLRARLGRDAATGAWLATPFPVQDSSLISVLAASGCLILRAPHAPVVPAGAPIPIIRLDRAPVPF
jgi:molybdopterin molybdotransferase